MKASRSSNTVGITPGEVRGCFPELREDLFYHLIDKNASGLEGAAGFIPVLKHIINQIHTSDRNFLGVCIWLAVKDIYLLCTQVTKQSGKKKSSDCINLLAM